ncbi:hypothetical protein BH10PSE2_BH10PSE2_20730 [soil metagenome]
MSGANNPSVTALKKRRATSPSLRDGEETALNSYRFNSAGSPPWAEMLLLIAFSDA